MGEDAVPREVVFVWDPEDRHDARLAKDPALLAERMRQAAVDGDVQAQLGFAHMLLEGHGTASDPEAALRWFQLASRAGSIDAINMIGRCHELGWGTGINTRMAAHCYRVAADMGHAWAQFNLASLMLCGDGAEGDRGEVLSLLVRSARRGNAKAMNLIGQACEEGWRGAPKIASARRWYARAARRGCFRGAFHTARHLSDDGDIERAVFWLDRSIAVAPGNFCAELGQHLADHPDARLRAVAERALAQARTAELPPEGPGSDIAKPPLGRPARGGWSLRRAFRTFMGAGRASRG